MAYAGSFSNTAVPGGSRKAPCRSPGESLRDLALDVRSKAPQCRTRDRSQNGGQDRSRWGHLGDALDDASVYRRLRSSAVPIAVPNAAPKATPSASASVAAPIAVPMPIPITIQSPVLMVHLHVLGWIAACRLPACARS